MMDTSDDEEDIYPNPDITIEYAVDMDQNEGDIGIHYFIIFLSFIFPEGKPIETSTSNVFHTGTSMSLKQVIKFYSILSEFYFVCSSPSERNLVLCFWSFTFSLGSVASSSSFLSFLLFSSLCLKMTKYLALLILRMMRRKTTLLRHLRYNKMLKIVIKLEKL